MISLKQLWRNKRIKSKFLRIQNRFKEDEYWVCKGLIIKHSAFKKVNNYAACRINYILNLIDRLVNTLLTLFSAKYPILIIFLGNLEILIYSFQRNKIKEISYLLNKLFSLRVLLDLIIWLLKISIKAIIFWRKKQEGLLPIYFTSILNKYKQKLSLDK